MAQSLYERPNTHSRAWEYWATRLAKRGEMPAAPRSKKVAAKAAPAKKKAAARPQTRKGRKRR
jgi:hypothetical protein